MSTMTWRAHCMNSYDKDCADPGVEETNNIYHVLKGPTLAGEEGRERES